MQRNVDDANLHSIETLQMCHRLRSKSNEHDKWTGTIEGLSCKIYRVVQKPDTQFVRIFTEQLEVWLILYTEFFSLVSKYRLLSNSVTILHRKAVLLSTKFCAKTEENNCYYSCTRAYEDFLFRPIGPTDVLVIIIIVIILTKLLYYIYMVLVIFKLFIEHSLYCLFMSSSCEGQK